MPPKGFQCEQCGHCCLQLNDAYVNSAYEDDIVRWREEGRDDILRCVQAIPSWDIPLVLDLWVNPRTGEDVQRCPWLRRLPHTNKCMCRIHDTKPKHCRDFPKTRCHAQKAGCPAGQKLARK